MNRQKKVFYAFLALFLMGANTPIKAMFSRKQVQQARRLTRAALNRIANILLSNEEINAMFDTTIFANLPAELHTKIINYMLKATTAENLDEAVSSIISLSLVNHELHDLITDKDYAIELCRYLARRFNSHTTIVAKMLHNKEAQKHFNAEVLGW